MQKVNAIELEKILEEMVIKNKLPVMIWGAPGIGKTQIVHDVMKKNGFEVLDLRLAYYEETDLLGIPVKDGNDGFKFLKYNMLPKMGKGVFFFDELTHAKTHIQGLIFQLILDGKIEDYNVPEGWKYFVGASNRISDKSISYEMPSGLKTRFLGGHYELVPDIEAWKKWALQNNINPILISFLEYQEKNDKISWLYRVDEDGTILTPRLWATGVNYALSLNEGIREKVLGGIIGSSNTATLIAYIKRVKHLPDIDKILKGDYKWFDDIKNEDNKIDLYNIFINGIVSRVNNNKSLLDNALRAMWNISNDELIIAGLSSLVKTIGVQPFLNSKEFNEKYKKYAKYVVEWRG